MSSACSAPQRLSRTAMDDFRRTQEDPSSASNRPSPGEAPRRPVWVSHTPPPSPSSDGHKATTEDGEEGGGSKGGSNPSSFLLLHHPRTWGPLLLLRRWRRNQGRVSANSTPSPLLHTGPSEGGSSPLLERGWRGEGSSGRSSSRGSSKPLLSNGKEGGRPLYWDAPFQCSGEEEGLEERQALPRPAQLYAHKLEAYRLRYAHLASWPGLLRLLAGLELLLGGAVCACVLPSLHRDQEWASAALGVVGTPGGFYRGPMTALVLAVVAVSWLLTLALLLVGMTAYYRAVLLPAPWWPPAEALLSLALFALHMVAGATRLSDMSRGGLCGGAVAGVGGPLLAALCRVDGSQLAGTAFLFLNALLYLGGFLVGLVLWRQQAARRHRALWRHPVDPQEEHASSITLTPIKQKHTRRIVIEDDMDGSLNQKAIEKHAHFTDDSELPVTRNKPTPTDVRKVHIIADYVIKYPEIHSVEERERYKAVFNDQYQEYRDLHRDICATLSKFRELDAMMAKLLKRGSNYEDTKRIQRITKNFEVKKNDPAFHEKNERYSYLKAKLNHIKKRIYVFDQDTAGNSWT